ncbi:condensation domain-containing protein, partial [Rhodococcus sp. KRD197]
MRAAVSGDSRSTPSQGVDASKAFPLSSAQRGMWFAQQLAPEVPVCIAQYVDLRGDLDLELLRKATRQAGHEFQSAFIRLLEVDGEPMQVIDHDIDDSVDYMDLRAESDPMGAAKAWIDANYTAPMDVMTDRLVSVWVIHVEDDRYLWYSKIHHVALDGYGAMTVVNRTAELYTAELEGREAAPAKAAALQTLYDLDQTYRSSSRFETDREYWAEHVGRAQDGATLAGTSGATIAASKLESAALPVDVVDALEDSDATKSATAAAVVIAAFACYLSRMTGREEVLVNIPVSARTTAVLRRSGGMLVNVAPLSIRVKHGQNVGELVQQVQLELMGALRHQRFSIEDIRRDLTSRGQSSALVGPLVNVMLFHQEIHLGPIVGEFNIVTSGPVEDLLVNVYQSGSPSRTFVDFRANPNRYEDDDLAEHHRNFVDIVGSFVAASPHDVIDDVHPDSAAIGRLRRLEREQLAYWTSVLVDAPDPVGLPGIAVGSRQDQPAPTSYTTSVDGVLHRTLLAAATAQNSSVLVSVHTALAVLLARMSGEPDVVIGARTPATRENVVALRGTVHSTDTFSDIAAQLRGVDAAALDHADVSLQSVSEALGEHATSSSDLVRVLLSFGCSYSPEDLGRADLVVHVEETFDALGVPAGLTIELAYREHSATEETIAAHAQRLIRLLTASAHTPTAITGDVELLSEAERAVLVPVRGGVSVAGRLLSEVFASAVAVAGVDAVA